MTKKCAIKDCTNHSNEGEFIGSLCTPCANTKFKEIIIERKLALTALRQISFYSRINHNRIRDYGEVADDALKAFGQPTGVL